MGVWERGVRVGGREQAQRNLHWHLSGDILEVTFCPSPVAILGEPSHGVLEPTAEMDTRMLTASALSL